MTYAMTIPDEMRRKYIERRRRDHADLANALAAGDFDVLYRVGHQLRGNAATFGYDSLTLLGERMEAASQARDRAEAEFCVEALGNWIREQSAS